MIRVIGVAAILATTFVGGCQTIQAAAAPAVGVSARTAQDGAQAAASAPAAPAKVIPPAATAAPAKTASQSGPEVFRIVPEESSVQYEVAEVLFREGNRFNVAVGVTKVVSGEVRVDRATPRHSVVGPIVVDISRLKSDRDRRDQLIRTQWLESSRFPNVTFRPTAIEGLPESYVEGSEFSARITGDLTIKETTKPATFALTGAVKGDTLTGVATTTIRMTDFGFDPPEILGSLKAENEAKLTFKFVARRQAG